jgi:ribosomal protein L37AE/L43A
MTLDRQYGTIVFLCDDCEDRFEGAPGEEFDRVYAAARRAGWRARKIENEWMHTCPECREDDDE